MKPLAISILAWLCLTASALALVEPSPLPYGTDGLGIPAAPVQLLISPRSIQLLGQSLQQTDVHHAGRARELASCGTPALPFLLRALQDPDPLLRGEAAHALASLADAEAWPQLAALLNDSDPRVRREAVLAAAALNHAHEVTAALDDPDLAVRRAAIISASTPVQADKIAAIFTTLPAALKPAALAAFGKLKAVNHTDIAVEALHASPAVRLSAVRALGQMRATAQVNSILEMLKDPFPPVRAAAVLAVGEIASDPLRQSTAMAMLADADPTVQQSAATVLQNAPTTAATDSLLKLLGGGYEPLRQASRRALVAIGPSVAPAAAAMLDSPDPRRREDASFLLGALRSDLNIARHVELLDDTDWGVIRQAAQSLRMLHPDPAATGPHLLKPFDRARGAPHDSDVIEAQRQALLLGGQLHFAPIMQIARRQIPRTATDPGAPDEIRTAALWAIGVIAGPEDPALKEIRKVPTDQFQSSAAAFEALKALYNAHSKSALDICTHWGTTGDTLRDNNCRWMAHFTADALAGTSTPFTVKPMIHAVNLSVEDLP
jgi:HEAT repeat protein